jgi:hypothetical protein
VCLCVLQALVAAQQAELQQHAAELEWHRQQTRTLAAAQRDRHDAVLSAATERFDAIRREVCVCERDVSE